MENIWKELWSPSHDSTESYLINKTCPTTIGLKTLQTPYDLQALRNLYWTHESADTYSIYKPFPTSIGIMKKFVLNPCIVGAPTPFLYAVHLS